MKYESLKSLYYQNPGNFERVYHSRFDSPEAVRTGLYVFPYDKKGKKGWYRAMKCSIFLTLNYQF